MIDILYVEYYFDVIGLVCLELVMLLYGKVCDMGVGEVLEVCVIDFFIEWDIFKFC